MPQKKVLTLVLLLSLTLCSALEAQQTTVRIGHFPNLTHAPALVAHNMSRSGEGFFEKRLGAAIKIEWYTYNAGPSAMEALMLDSIDASYVGPNPAINAFVRTKGEEVRIIAGSTLGGAALVVQGDGRIKSAADFKGKKIATPQLGNTQDVAARAWFKAQGLNVTQTGGDLNIIPTENPEQLSLFQANQIDGAWTVEPWVSRLEREGKGSIFISDQDSIATVLVVSKKLLNTSPQLVSALNKANQELIEWINANPAEAQKRVSAELLALTSKPVAPELLASAWPRMRFDATISLAQLQSFVDAAKQVGFLKDAGDLSGMLYVTK